MQAVPANANQVSMKKLYGRAYGSWWRDRRRIIFTMGGRASKKSTMTAAWIMKNILKYPLANAVIARRFLSSNYDSTYAQCEREARRQGTYHLFQFAKNPMTITVKATGQKILFRGFDNMEKLCSLQVAVGVMCWAWIEEASEIKNEQEYNKFEACFRGIMPEGYFVRIFITMNPWSKDWWGKKRFWDPCIQRGDWEPVKGGSHPLIGCYRRNYECNEFLSEEDLAYYEDMRINRPEAYRVEGQGEWGISEGLVYTNFVVEEWDKDTLAMEHESHFNSFTMRYDTKYSWEAHYGLDFGWTNPTAFVAFLVNYEKRLIYVFDEIYASRISNDQLYITLKERGYERRRIIADSEDPKTISELNNRGCKNIIPAYKPANSTIAGIKKIQGFKIIISPNCVNFISEISNYIWAQPDVPVKKDDHLMDAFRYAMLEVGDNPFELPAVYR